MPHSKSQDDSNAVLARYTSASPLAELGYATVRDYCDSLDHLPAITGFDGDLKNVQRPWTVKALLATVPPPARILEIGGGEPIISSFLSDLGYDVTLIDPYDGFGNGPTTYEAYLKNFPNVRLIRAYFQPGMPQFPDDSLDAVFSISVLEHLPDSALDSCFRAIQSALVPGGASIHCFDHVIDGPTQEHHALNANAILAEQAKLAGRPPGDCVGLIEQMQKDVETFYLSPQGHHLWRGGQAYEQFPFRKVASIQSVVRKAV